MNFHGGDVNDQNGEASSTMVPEENHWLDGGTKLPYDPDPTEEWDGELTQEFEDHKIDLSPTNSLKGHDVHPDPIDHNAIWGDHAKQASKFAYDSEDTDYAEDEDYADREEGKEKKESSVGPRQAFVDYLNLIDSNSLVREAAWSDVRRKANRLYREGNVAVEYNDGKEIQAKVIGDHGRYAVKVMRKNAFGKGITWYDCDCEWGKWAYKRARTFVGRLCSHGLATYFAMQANKQPEKPVKRINDKVERHTLAAAPKAHRVETESLAARSGGLMIWDDDLQKVVKNFFPSPPSAAQVSADPSSGAGDPSLDPGTDPAGTIGPDMSSELASDTPAAPTFDGADSNFMPDPSPGTPITDKVRTAEFSKNPKTDDLFEEWPEANSEDAETFNDTDKRYKDKDNDPEFAFYDEFWGRSSSTHEAGPYEDAFRGGLDPKSLMDIAKQPTITPSINDAPIPEPGRKLPHFIRRNKTSADRSETEGHTPEELEAIARAFNLNGQPEEAKKFVDNRYRVKADNHSDGNVDYPKSVLEDHETNWEDHPNDGVNGDSDSYNKDNDHYQSDHWLDEDEAEWKDHEAEDDDSDDDEFLKKGWNSKASAFQNEAEAEEFNADADAVVREFQRSAAAQALFSDSGDSGAFMTVATDPNGPKRVKTAGRHFTFSEQQDLIDEPGTARHVADLNLDDTFYLD